MIRSVNDFSMIEVLKKNKVFHPMRLTVHRESEISNTDDTPKPPQTRVDTLCKNVMQTICSELVD
jgi:hypothetical protein